MERINVFSKTPWEEIVGYARAVKVGNLIKVAGTTAVEGTTIVGKESAYEQTRFIFQKIAKTLGKLDASLEHVVATRMYVTDIGLWEEIGKAHGEVFQHIRPVATMVGVQALIHPDLLVEIEVEAIV